MRWTASLLMRCAREIAEPLGGAGLVALVGVEGFDDARALGGLGAKRNAGRNPRWGLGDGRRRRGVGAVGATNSFAISLTLIARCEVGVGPSAVSAIVVLTNAVIGDVVTSLTTRRRLVTLIATSPRSVRFIRSSYMKNRNW